MKWMKWIGVFAAVLLATMVLAVPIPIVEYPSLPPNTRGVVGDVAYYRPASGDKVYVCLKSRYGWIDIGQYAPNSITTTYITDEAITTTKILDGAVDSSKIADAAIYYAHLSMALRDSLKSTLWADSAGIAVVADSAIVAGAVNLAVPLPVLQGGTGADNASDARTNLGVAIGSDVQAYDADLAAVVGEASFSSANWVDLTDAGESSLHYHASDRALANATGTLPVANGGTGATTESGARTNLGVAIGTDVQAHDSDLDAIVAQASFTSANWTDLTDAGTTTLHFHAADRALGNATGILSLTQGGTGETSPSAAASALGLGTEDSPTFTGLTVTGTASASAFSGDGSALTSVPADWADLTSVPAGFADGIDNTGANAYSLDAADGDPTQVVYVDNDGDVGVGTTTPTEKLDVVGNLTVSGTISGTLASALPVAQGGTGATTASDARTNLGVAVGSDVQAWDAQLDDLAGLAVTDGNFAVADGANWTAESGATARASMGVAIGSDVQAHDSDLDAVVALASFTSTNWTDLTDAGESALHYHSSDRNLANATGTLALANGGTGATTASTARTALGLGSSDTPNFAGLSTYTATSSGLTELGQIVLGNTAGNATLAVRSDIANFGRIVFQDGIVGNDRIRGQLYYSHATDSWTIFADATAVVGITSTSLSVNTVSEKSTDAGVTVDGVLLKDGVVGIAYGGTGSTTAADARAALDLEPGVDVQAYDTGLADIAGLAVTDGNFIVGDGANWVAESGNTARGSLGLSTTDSPEFAGLGIGAARAISQCDLYTSDDASHAYLVCYTDYSGTAPKVQLYADASRNGAVVVHSSAGLTRAVISGGSASYMYSDLAIGGNSPTAALDVNDDVIRLRSSKTPASASATGNQGDICWDANYIYVCTATNTWVRAALSTW